MIANLKKIIARLKRMVRDDASFAFVQHNIRVFAAARADHPRKRQILFELNAMHSAHIAYSYLANLLAIRDAAVIKSYLPSAPNTVLQRLGFAIDKFFGTRELGIFTSFGAQDCLVPRLSGKQQTAAQRLFEKTVDRLKSTKDVEDLAIDGVWIGDLVYDTYLMTYKQPTIDLASPDFRSSLKNSIELFFFWDDYINIDSVSAINVSHCVYNQALPLRIGVKKNIPVFQLNITHIYRLNEENLFAYNDFIYYRKRFMALPKEIQIAGMKEAEQRINRRFAGEVGVDMSYSTKSAYGKFKKNKLIRESTVKKVLIATHCFFDSPHSYGINLFTDFYEWLDFLGQMTLLTDYDWYIKTHPDYLQGTKEIIDAFIFKYPKFTLLPSDTSHHQLIAEGIDVALTVYGTIGFEYAALGVPVINASMNNPHIAYDFNLHPKIVEEYRRLLMAPELWNIVIDKQQIYEYYFMRHIYNTENLFFEDSKRMIDELGGYDAQFTPAVYQKWLDEWSMEKHQTILLSLQKFIKSGDFRMDYTHYGKEFSAASIEVTR